MAKPTLPEICELDVGTRWWKCALQVNPFSYTQKFPKGGAAQFLDEETYNAAVVASLLRADVQVIGTADHWCIDSSTELEEAATKAGIVVFPGFEATSKDGVHLLLLFNPGTSAAEISRRIGECGIPVDCLESLPGKLDCREMLALVQEWHAVIVAPHVTTDGGLLNELNGQAAVAAWKDLGLHAVALSGGTLSQKNTAILRNTNAEYLREHPLALLCAADISDPADVTKRGASCWIKMSSLTIEGLDVAFRSPETRVSLDDPTGTHHTALLGMAWDGGFLDGVRMRFNESLNVLVGGRGSGKSTVIESLRYAFGLEPVGSNAKSEHDSMVGSRDVLGAGTSVSVVVETRQPHPERFIVRRTVPHPPVVLTEDGARSALRPHDLVSGLEVYGQRELAELARDKNKLTSLLGRYVPDAEQEAGDQRQVRRKLQESRTAILQLRAEIEALDEQIERLPSLRERLRSFQKAGIAERLEDQTRVQREGELLFEAQNATLELTELPTQLRDNWSIDTEFLAPDDLSDLPNRLLLDEAAATIAALNRSVEDAAVLIEEALEVAVEALADICSRWDSASQATREALDGILRELQPAGADAEEYLTLQRQVTRLTPLDRLRRAKAKELRQLELARTTLIVEAEGLHAARVRTLKAAARRLSKSLRDVVRVEISDGEDRAALTKVINQLPGRTDKIRLALESASMVSVRELAAVCRAGSQSIMVLYPEITQGQADALADAGEEMFLRIEEVELPIGTELQLNIRLEGSTPSWRGLSQLSTGQRATALLLLLLQGGDAPLIIDQPEDDLDNRFVYESVVPRVRESKRGRQLLFASHNANIPVLGDADQIIGLTVVDREGAVIGTVDPAGVGAIDQPSVRALVEEVLEGGREAFEMRRYLYGF
jgi:DNA repair ATPase RecN